MRNPRFLTGKPGKAEVSHEVEVTSSTSDFSSEKGEFSVGHVKFKYPLEKVSRW